MAFDKIKRQFIWLRKTLELIDKTTLPGEILGEVRPTLDTFGWDRLSALPTFANTFDPAPAIEIDSAIVPEGVARLFLCAAVRHTEPAVNHFMWIERVQPAALECSITNPTVALPPTVAIGVERPFLLSPGEFLRAKTDVALIAGALALDVVFIDLPFGEYIPPV